MDILKAKQTTTTLIRIFTEKGFHAVCHFYELNKTMPWFETFSYQVDQIHQEENHVAFCINYTLEDGKKSYFQVFCSFGVLEIKNEKGIVSKTVKQVVTHYFDQDAHSLYEVLSTTMGTSENVNRDQLITDSQDLLINSFNEKKGIYECVCFDSDKSDLEIFNLEATEILEWVTRFQMRVKGWIF